MDSKQAGGTRQTMWRVMEQFVKAGKARAIGVSHYCKRHLLFAFLAVALLPCVAGARETAEIGRDARWVDEILGEITLLQPRSRRHEQTFHLLHGAPNLCHEQAYVDPDFRRKGYVNGSCPARFNALLSRGYETVCTDRSGANLESCQGETTTYSKAVKRVGPAQTNRLRPARGGPVVTNILASISDQFFAETIAMVVNEGLRYFPAELTLPDINTKVSPATISLSGLSANIRCIGNIQITTPALNTVHVDVTGLQLDLSAEAWTAKALAFHSSGIGWYAKLREGTLSLDIDITPDVLGRITVGVEPRVDFNVNYVEWYSDHKGMIHHILSKLLNSKVAPAIKATTASTVKHMVAQIESTINDAFQKLPHPFLRLGSTGPGLEVLLADALVNIAGHTTMNIGAQFGLGHAPRAPPRETLHKLKPKPKPRPGNLHDFEQAPWPAQTLTGNLPIPFAAKEEGVTLALTTELVKNFLWMLDGQFLALHELKIPTSKLNTILKRLRLPAIFNTTKLKLLPPFNCLFDQFPGDTFDVWIHPGLEDAEINILHSNESAAVFGVKLPTASATLQMADPGPRAAALVMKAPLSFTLSMVSSQEKAATGSSRVVQIVPTLSDVKLSLFVDTDASSVCKDAKTGILSDIAAASAPLVGDVVTGLLKKVLRIPDDFNVTLLGHELQVGDLKFGGLPRTGDDFDGAVLISLGLSWVPTGLSRLKTIKSGGAPKCADVPKDSGGLCYAYTKGNEADSCCEFKGWSKNMPTCGPFFPVLADDVYHGHPRS
eukprot:g3041.t1